MTQSEICRALTMLRPGAAWSVRGDALSGIDWLDEAAPRPGDNEIMAAIAGFAADDLVAYAREMRLAREVGGITWNGHLIATDREISQPRLTAEYVAVFTGQRIDPSPWRFAGDDRVMLSNADMSAVCIAARGHIASVDGIEAQLVAGITGGSVTTMAQVAAAFA